MNEYFIGSIIKKQAMLAIIQRMYGTDTSKHKSEWLSYYSKFD